MNIPKLIDLVKEGAQVEFVRYQDMELWYRTESGFEFPVPVLDTGNGAFLPRDKALFFMRWIKKHLAFVEQSQKEQKGTV